MATGLGKETSRTEDDVNSMHRAMIPVLLVAQCFGLFPVQGITSKHCLHVRFTWKSYRVLYSFAVILMLLTTIGFTIAWYITVGFSFSTSGALMFPFTGLVCCVLFVQVARDWPGLVLLWHRTECAQARHGYPSYLRRQIRCMAAVILIISVVENLLANVSSWNIAAQCATDSEDLTRRYYKQNHKHVFDVVPYSTAAAVFATLSNVAGTFCWNFADLFMMLISVALASRFRQLNNTLRHAGRKAMPESFWRAAREDFNHLAHLTRRLDSCVSGVTLLCFGTNLFYICQQLLNTMKTTRSAVATVYFYYSFGYLAMRTVAMALFMSTVYEQSQIPKQLLYFVPTEAYDIEVHRFLAQATTDTVALTGLNFFPVTRTLLLTLAGTIVTYEIVLVQFGNTSKDTIQNVTALCLELE